jgi:hypothetical protein
MVPLLALLPVITTVIDRVAALIPDPTARARAIAEAQTEAISTLSRSDASQADTNTVQAANTSSLFIGGARPAFMWLGVILVGWSLAVRDLVVAVAVNWSPNFTLPVVPTDELWTLVFGMLGLGALRSFEKVKGVATTGVSR